jgi:hypothetical protein
MHQEVGCVIEVINLLYRSDELHHVAQPAPGNPILPGHAALLAHDQHLQAAEIAAAAQQAQRVDPGTHPLETEIVRDAERQALVVRDLIQFANLPPLPLPLLWISVIGGHPVEDFDNPPRVQPVVHAQLLDHVVGKGQHHRRADPGQHVRLAPQQAALLDVEPLAEALQRPTRLASPQRPVSRHRFRVRPPARLIHVRNLRGRQRVNYVEVTRAGHPVGLFAETQGTQTAHRPVALQGDHRQPRSRRHMAARDRGHLDTKRQQFVDELPRRGLRPPAPGVQPFDDQGHLHERRSFRATRARKRASWAAMRLRRRAICRSKRRTGLERSDSPPRYRLRNRNRKRGLATPSGVE